MKWKPNSLVRRLSRPIRFLAEVKQEKGVSSLCANQRRKEPRTETNRWQQEVASTQAEANQYTGETLNLEASTPHKTSPRPHLPHLVPNALNRLLAIALTLAGTYAGYASAADRLTLRAGSLEQTVEVEDLEHFAETGELRSSLKLYRPLLTPQVQQLLNQRFEVDPSVADTFLNQLLERDDGEQLLDQLKRALPESSINQLKAALYLTLRQANGLSVLSFLRAYPQETVTIDATAALGIVLQLNTSNLQSQLLSPVLGRELSAASEGFRLPDFDPRIEGEHRVRQRAVVLYDRDRDRQIPVDLFYSAETRGPLVVLSHGFAADRNFLSYLAFHLASHGFSVVALEHPGSNIENIAEISFNLSPNDILAASEFVDRPKDVSFVLDELERMSQDWGYLKGKFNTEQVTVIGHSLGGYTALALAGAELDLKELRNFCQNLSPLGRSPADWLQCAAVQLPDSQLRLQDKRIAQAIALNPVVGKLFGTRGLEQVETPVLLFSSSEDAITPAIDNQLRPFEQLRGEKYLVTAIGATHMSITDVKNINSMVGQSTLVREVMGVEAEPVRQLLRGMSLAFVSQLTPERDRYRPFLTADYVQSLSTAKLPMRLTTKLPSTLDAWLQVLQASHQKIAYREPRETAIAKANPRPFAKIYSGTRCLFSAGLIIPSLRPCKGELNHIFTSLLSNYPT
ncbi:MAG: alpha/beta fold hydrolase [Cyanobacteriota bacterium]|nr:alpha/beta fold hydrolase [Cyanobacteriota bacterium]